MVILLGTLAVGCAASRPRSSVTPFVPPAGTVVALLPFEDLTGRAGVSEAFSRVFFAELVRTGAFTVVEPGLVDDAVEGLAVRTTRAMTAEEIRALGDSLGATHVLFGNVLESGTVRGQDGEYPSVAATLRLVETSTGRVVWACHHSRTGHDRETVFGWGREWSHERLLGQLAVEMLEDLRTLGSARRTHATEGGTAP